MVKVFNRTMYFGVVNVSFCRYYYFDERAGRFMFGQTYHMSELNPEFIKLIWND